ncbi:MAG: BolA family protein [Pseudomonadota bacterium]|nr:BolA family protein [Pseudomonadota bacterium]MEE3281346.1 BolA family protein [Pseudomonadota bacterium]|tara:strand:+ start:375 stop:704 length:330 start_codon:yes stop_codon:yes gene_type:complete
MAHSTDDHQTTADTGQMENVSKKRAAMVRERLYQDLGAEFVEVDDQTHLHAGHSGAAAGGSHFEVVVISKAFEGLATLARHRLVYQAVGDAMTQDIHALSIKAYTPGEV